MLGPWRLLFFWDWSVLHPFLVPLVFRPSLHLNSYPCPRRHALAGSTNVWERLFTLSSTALSRKQSSVMARSFWSTQCSRSFSDGPSHHKVTVSKSVLTTSSLAVHMASALFTRYSLASALFTISSLLTVFVLSMFLFLFCSP